MSAGSHHHQQGAFNGLPKIVSVIYRAPDRAALVDTYIVRPISDDDRRFRTNSLKTVIRDLTDQFRIRGGSNTPDSSTNSSIPLKLTDVNGKPIRSFHELYCYSPSTLVLCSDEGQAMTDYIVQERGRSAQAKNSKKAVVNGEQNWLYGQSRLCRIEPVIPQPPSPSPERSRKQRKSSNSSRVPRVANLSSNKIKHSKDENNNDRSASKKTKKSSRSVSSGKENKSKTSTRNSSKSSKKKSKDTDIKSKSSKTTKNKEESEEPVNEKVVAAQPTTSATVEASAKKPLLKSQIEAQKEKVQMLQDKMAEGESFLDKIGRNVWPPVQTARAPTTASGNAAVFGERVHLDSKPRCTPSQPVRRRDTISLSQGWAVEIDQKPVIDASPHPISKPAHINPSEEDIPQDKELSPKDEPPKPGQVDILTVHDVSGSPTPTTLGETVDDETLGTASANVRPGTVTLKRHDDHDQTEKE